MELSLDEVHRLARLARIAISDAEAAAVSAQLGGIFGLIEQMQAVDTSGVEPMAHAQDLVLRLREDVVTEADARERFLALAPDAQDGLYVVPQVIE